MYAKVQFTTKKEKQRNSVCAINSRILDFFFHSSVIYPGTSNLAKLIANLNGAPYTPTHSQKWEEVRRCQKGSLVRVM